jgi:hypothetical protein
MSEMLNNLIGTLQKAQRAHESLEKVRLALEILDDAYRSSNSDDRIDVQRLEFIQRIRDILKAHR